MRHTVRWREQGFSLMEMLVAITITALLSTAVIASFRMGISSWKRGGEFLDRSQRLAAAVELIQKQVGSITSMVSAHTLNSPINAAPAVSGEAKTDLTFVGGPQEMVFVSDYLLSPLGAGGLQLVHYTVEWPERGTASVSTARAGSTGATAASGMVLRMTTTPIYRRTDFLNLAVATRNATPQTLTLLEGIRDIAFHYWGEGEPSAPGASAENLRPIVAYDRWDGSKQKTLPDAVAIQIRFGGAGRRGEISQRYNRDGVDLYIPVNVTTKY